MIRRLLTAILALALCLTSIPAPAIAASSAPVRGAHGMVASPEAHAARVGRDVLEEGGNAVDAAVAIAFALSVTYPRAGSLGGGGFLLYRSASGEVHALDFRETAPRKLEARLFLDESGKVIAERSRTSGLAVGVPGLVAGLAEAHRLWGSRSWRELVKPAIRLANTGIPVSKWNAECLAEEQKKLAAHGAARAIFFREGKPLREGDRLVQRDLARTLRKIADNGTRGFYHGEVAATLVATVRRAGGILEEEDLAAYRPVAREPLRGTYRGYRVIAFPPPSSGGVVLLQVLGMLERYDLRSSGAGSSLTVHRMVEAERRAFADRSRLIGDPEFVKVPLPGLLDSAYVASRAATIRDDAATPSATVPPGSPPGSDATHTLHFSVADSKGNTVAFTTTLNSDYGAGIVAGGTGVVLNDEMDDFSLAPDTPNQFGLVGGSANAVAPGRRPLSSMCPVIVEAEGGKGRPVLVLGSRGGPRIISSVLEVLVNVVDFGMTLPEAIDAPRFHHQWLPDLLYHEKGAFSEDVAAALRARGHELSERAAIGNVAAIGLLPDGAYSGAPDPREEGTALGY